MACVHANIVFCRFELVLYSCIASTIFQAMYMHTYCLHTLIIEICTVEIEIAIRAAYVLMTMYVLCGHFVAVTCAKMAVVP